MVKGLSSDTVNKKAILKIVEYIKPIKYQYIINLVLTVMAILFSVIQPMIWARILTSVFKGDLGHLGFLILLISIYYAFQLIANIVQSWVSSSLTENMALNIKRDMFNNLLNFPMSVFDHVSEGELISRLVNDAYIIVNFVTNRLIAFAINIIKIIVIGYLIFKISSFLSLTLLTSIPLLVMLFWLSGRITRRLSRQLSSLNDQYFSNIKETLGSMKEVKALGIKEIRYNGFHYLASTLRNQNIKISLANNLSQTSTQAIIFIYQIIVIYCGSRLVSASSINITDFIVFTTYSTFITNSSLELISFNSTLQQSLVSLQRVLYFIENLSSSQLKDESDMDIVPKGAVSFHNVTFSYDERSPVLREISFVALENTLTAIIGPSGSGKTSIFNLIMRFYTPSAGEVLIDNINVRRLSENNHKSIFSVIVQEPTLFRGTIMENLRISDSNIHDLEVIEACRRVYIHDYITSLPKGYHTQILEGGKNFSVGQKQRLAIARALLRGTKVILFDEPTSALDVESQEVIKNVLEDLSKDHTIIVISHQLSTICNADKVIILNQGQIVFDGDHSEIDIDSYLKNLSRAG